ncbi:MAG: ABC transporter permease [Candidatus Aminicenantes bacterium]|nr:MAG: ABC transporter permease [Candidatus Aminicenantes bacterium]
MKRNVSKNNHWHHGTCCGYPRILRIIGVVLLGVVLAGLFALVFGFLVKILWNALMPAIFDLTKITYWQAVGMVILVKLLFGYFGRHHPDPHLYFQKKIEDKWHRRFRKLKIDEDDDLWKPKGSHEYWKYYKDYWKAEGKAAFEAYIDKIEEEKKEKEKKDD